MITVAGYCPMGCGRTLNLDDDGHVTCSLIGCPNPTAVDDILGDAEIEHVVEFTPTHFSVMHPLRERLDDSGGLLECRLHQFIQGLDGPPVKPGRYRARPSSQTWTWELLPGDAA